MDGLEETALPMDCLSTRRILSLNISYNEGLDHLKGISKLAELKKLEAEHCGLESEDIHFASMQSLVIL